MNDTIRSIAGVVSWSLVFASGLPDEVLGEHVVIETREAGRDGPVPCRIHLRDAAGKPHRPPDLPFWRDHFVCNGFVELDLPKGDYAAEIDRGPEYKLQTTQFRMTDKTPTRLTFELERIRNMAREGWWSGELHVHRPIQDIELLMRAEDLHVAPVITWWNNRNLWTDQAIPEQIGFRFDRDRFYNVMAGEDEREGGALLYFGLRRPLAITQASREYPSPLQFLKEARADRSAWIDIEKPFWWDVPTWVALGPVDSIGLANNHMCRDQMYENEAWGRPRDTDRLPAPLGNGYWSQEIYYQILNAGLRIPPSAGSASGVLPNPVGYNRVYAFVRDEFTEERWWQALRAGKSFVTNGPLLVVRADGEPPGHIFEASDKFLSLALSVSLTSRDPISRVELIRNGQIEQAISGADWSAGHRFRYVEFRESGWFLVRAIADNPTTFRFASTAPFYVEVGSVKNRISRSAANFFVDWVNERMQRVKLDDSARRREVLQYHEEAKRFWEAKAAQANAD